MLPLIIDFLYLVPLGISVAGLTVLYYVTRRMKKKRWTGLLVLASLLVVRRILALLVRFEIVPSIPSWIPDLLLSTLISGLILVIAVDIAHSITAGRLDLFSLGPEYRQKSKQLTKMVTKISRKLNRDCQ